MMLFLIRSGLIFLIGSSLPMRAEDATSQAGVPSFVSPTNREGWNRAFDGLAIEIAEAHHKRAVGEPLHREYEKYVSMLDQYHHPYGFARYHQEDIPSYNERLMKSTVFLVSLWTSGTIFGLWAELRGQLLLWSSLGLTCCLTKIGFELVDASYFDTNPRARFLIALRSLGIYQRLTRPRLYFNSLDLDDYYEDWLESFLLWRQNKSFRLPNKCVVNLKRLAALKARL